MFRIYRKYLGLLLRPNTIFQNGEVQFATQECISIIQSLGLTTSLNISFPFTDIFEILNVLLIVNNVIYVTISVSCRSHLKLSIQSAMFTMLRTVLHEVCSPLTQSNLAFFTDKHVILTYIHKCFSNMPPEQVHQIILLVFFQLDPY